MALMPRRAALGLAVAVLCASACGTLPGRDALTVDQHMRLGASYEEQGLRTEAKREYEAALRSDKEFVPAYVALGNLAFEDGALVEAEHFYRRVLEREAEHPGANNNLAVVYLTRGADLDAAERHARRALAGAGALRPYVLDTLAHIYMKQNRYLDAKAALDDADVAAPSQNGFLRQRLAQSRRRLETL